MLSSREFLIAYGVEPQESFEIILSLLGTSITIADGEATDDQSGVNNKVKPPLFDLIEFTVGKPNDGTMQIYRCREINGVSADKCMDMEAVEWSGFKSLTDYYKEKLDELGGAIATKQTSRFSDTSPTALEDIAFIKSIPFGEA